jgi:hypothetical protein
VSGAFASKQDVDRLRSEVAELRRKVRELEIDDVVIDNGRALKLRSPNGTYFGLVVDNAGALSTVSLGTSL